MKCQAILCDEEETQPAEIHLVYLSFVLYLCRHHLRLLRNVRDEFKINEGSSQ